MTANLACFAARQCEPDHNVDKKLEPACQNAPSGTFSQNGQKTEIARRLKHRQGECLPHPRQTAERLDMPAQALLRMLTRIVLPPLTLVMRRLLHRGLAQNHEVHVFIVAHLKASARRRRQGLMPTVYDIAGSANWAHKADLGFAVHRPDFEAVEVEIRAHKARCKWVGKIRRADFRYDEVTGSYSETGSPI